MGVDGNGKRVGKVSGHQDHIDRVVNNIELADVYFDYKICIPF